MRSTRVSSRPHTCCYVHCCSTVVDAHVLFGYKYANSSYIYCSCLANCASHLSIQVLHCITSVDKWMQTSTFPSDLDDIAGVNVSAVSNVHDIVILIDSDLGAASHVRIVVWRHFGTYSAAQYRRPSFIPVVAVSLRNSLNLTWDMQLAPSLVVSRSKLTTNSGTFLI